MLSMSGKSITVGARELLGVSDGEEKILYCGGPVGEPIPSNDRRRSAEDEGDGGISFGSMGNSCRSTPHYRYTVLLQGDKKPLTDDLTIIRRK